MAKKNKQVERSWFFYNSDKVANWANWALFLVAQALYVFVFFVAPYPDSLQTTEKLQYLPENIELATVSSEFLNEEENLSMVNQVDIQTLEEYIAYSSETVGTHFLIVSSEGSLTNFNYYYAEPGNAVLRHYFYESESPFYWKMFDIGYFNVSSYYLEGDNLIVEREFYVSDVVIALLLVLIPWIVGGILWLCYVSEKIEYIVNKIANR